jgi:GNAT superfamily N-acetyltransferase
VQEGNLQIDGEMYSAGWIVDVMILPSHRGLGLGHKLYDAVAEELPILVTLTMAEATRRSRSRRGEAIFALHPSRSSNGEA